MLTSALETNNEALDAAVIQLDKFQEWRAEYADVAAVAAMAPAAAVTPSPRQRRRRGVAAG